MTLIIVPEQETFNNRNQQRWQDDKVRSPVEVWKYHIDLVDTHNNAVA